MFRFKMDSLYEDTTKELRVSIDSRLKVGSYKSNTGKRIKITENNFRRFTNDLKAGNIRPIFTGDIDKDTNTPVISLSFKRI